MGPYIGYPNFAPVVPSDAADLPSPCQGIMVTVAGNVVCRNLAGQDITIPVPVGVILPISTRRILATGTTATGIIAFW